MWIWLCRMSRLWFIKFLQVLPSMKCCKGFIIRQALLKGWILHKKENMYVGLWRHVVIMKDIINEKNIEIIQAQILQCCNKEHSLQKMRKAFFHRRFLRSSISTYYYLSLEECVATYACHSYWRHSFQYIKTL